ncbi:MAG TPA: hypothetical protein VFJ58_17565 [Armatimonadota bacterium]|nr:hypothetical protein [Armatimonadota bacterium]
MVDDYPDRERALWKSTVTGQARTKLLTFESWVSRPDWFAYAESHPDRVPFLLTDRSPCQDPFFDPFAPSARERRPLISGLCRCLKGFREGDRFIYITRIHSAVGRKFGLSVKGAGPHYFGVAALVVKKVWPSHADAARSFARRRYVVSPSPTPYPPNLAHERRPIAACARESCIVHDLKGRPYTPLESDGALWRQAYLAYHLRQRENAMRAAECRIELVDGREVLRLEPGSAPVFTPGDWGGLRLNVKGRWIDEETSRTLRMRIAR